MTLRDRIPVPMTLLPMILLLCGCGGSEGRVLLTEREFARYASLPVTIEGVPRKAYLAGDTCYYAEWAAGPFYPDGTGAFEPIFQSSDSIVIVSPHGLFPTDLFSLRLYLRSTLSRTFDPESASGAPLPVQEAVRRLAGTIAVREYVLRPEQTYWARLAFDTLRGRSDEAGETVVAIRRIVELSDRPFDGPRLSPVTPATQTP